MEIDRTHVFGKMAAVMFALFGNLNRLLALERQHLKFLRSSEDKSIVIAIGNAAETGVPIGYKQLTLMNIASPSTVNRNLKRLVAGKVIRRVVQRNDGRMVNYVLTKKTLECFERYYEQVLSLQWQPQDAASREK
jgi:DNA-binding MarR family transcriptional regulator